MARDVLQAREIVHPFSQHCRCNMCTKYSSCCLKGRNATVIRIILNGSEVWGCELDCLGRGWDQWAVVELWVSWQNSGFFQELKDYLLLKKDSHRIILCNVLEYLEIQRMLSHWCLFGYLHRSFLVLGTLVNWACEEPFILVYIFVTES